MLNHDALSYAWGNPYFDKDTWYNESQDWSKTTKLIVDYIQNGMRHKTTLNITPNLDGGF